MSDDPIRKRLEAKDLERKHSSQRTLWDLIGKMHAQPVLRDWLTLESQPLHPYVQLLETEAPAARVYVLVAAPKPPAGLYPPWGLIGFTWPHGRIVMLEEIEGEGDLAWGADGGELLVASRASIDLLEKAISSRSAIAEPPEVLRAWYRGLVPRLRVDRPSQEPAAPLGKDAQAPDPVSSDPGPQSSVQTPPGTSAEPPPNESLDRVLEEAGRWVAEDAKGPMAAELRRLRLARNAARFSVAVVGEIARGKSTVVNRLLGAEVIPIGQPQSRRMLCRVLHGPEARLLRRDAEGRLHRFSLDEEGWPRALEVGGGDMRVVTLEIPNPWLDAAKLQLLDTPGAGDLPEPETKGIADAIAGSDGILFVVSATMPLSLTERILLRQSIISRGIPKIAAVLTRLDQVPEAQRESVVQHVRRSLELLRKDIQLWNLSPCESIIEGFDVVDVDAARRELSRWANDQDLERQRRLQLGRQLDALLRLARSGYELQAALAAEDAGRAEEAKRSAIVKLDGEALIWRDVRLAFEERCRGVVGQLEDDLRARGGEALKVLRAQLQHTAAPAEWWKKQLPDALALQLESRVKVVEAALMQRMQSDFRWLEAEVSGRLAWNLSRTTPGAPGVAVTTDGVGDEGGHRDLRRVQISLRIGGAALGAVSTVLFGPLGLVIGSGVGLLLSEQVVRRLRDEEVQSLLLQLDEVIARCVDRLAEEGAERVRASYRLAIGELERQAAAWRAARERAIAEASSPGSVARRAREAAAGIEAIGRLLGELNLNKEELE